MHDIEPFYSWREKYQSEEDPKSPFYQREHSEIYFENQIYNYYIHPQWDSFGSKTLYIKVLFCDYDKHFCILELIGEWNDCLYNDIMFLYESVIQKMIGQGITKYFVVCENVLNFFGSDDCYYEEWWDEIKEYGGWIAFVGLLPHVQEEMYATNLHYYVNLFDNDQSLHWRKYDPKMIRQLNEKLIQSNRKLS